MAEVSETAPRVDEIPDQPGYSVRIIKGHVLPFYAGEVLLHGEKIAVVPLLGDACLNRESVIAQAKRYAETHRENSQPPIPLDLAEGAES